MTDKRRTNILSHVSRRSNCHNNAPAESVWSRFKAELLDGGRFPGLVEAGVETSHRIACYDAGRRHSALGHLSPRHSEAHRQVTSRLCPA